MNSNIIQNILAIGAHYDDIEIGCGGSLLKFAKSGINVYAIVVTNSGWKSVKGINIRTNENAKQEGINASSIIKTKMLDTLGYNTCNVQYTDDLIVKLLKIIEKYNIDTVFTHWIEDIHQDHKAIAKASLTACKHVSRVLMYRSNWYDSVTPFKDCFYINISEEMNEKKEAIKCFKSEMERTNFKWIDWIEKQNSINGYKFGCKYAESFQIQKYLI